MGLNQIEGLVSFAWFSSLSDKQIDEEVPSIARPKLPSSKSSQGAAQSPHAQSSSALPKPRGNNAEAIADNQPKKSVPALKQTQAEHRLEGMKEKKHDSIKRKGSQTQRAGKTGDVDVCFSSIAFCVVRLMVPSAFVDWQDLLQV